MAQHAVLVAVDRAPLGTVCVNHQPRSPAQWRGGSLSGCRVRSARLGSGAASKALQAGFPDTTACGREADMRQNIHPLHLEARDQARDARRCADMCLATYPTCSS